MLARGGPPTIPFLGGHHAGKDLFDLCAAEGFAFALDHQAEQLAGLELFEACGVFQLSSQNVVGGQRLKQLRRRHQIQPESQCPLQERS